MFLLPLFVNGASMCIIAQDISSFIILPLFSSSKWFHHLSFITSSMSPRLILKKPFKLMKNSFNFSFCLSYQFLAVEDHYDDDGDTNDNFSFDGAVTVFNDKVYYKCYTILKLSGTWPKNLPELLFTAFYNV